MSTVEFIFLTASFYCFATGLVIVAINPWRTINRVCLIAATLSSLWLFCIFMAMHIGQSESYNNREKDILLWLRMTNAVAAFLPCSYFLIKIAILGPISKRELYSRIWPWLTASCMLATLAFSESFIPSHSTPEIPLHGIGYSIYTWSLSGLCILIIFDGTKELRRCWGVRRLEMKFFVINFCLTTLLVMFTFVSSKALALSVLRYAAPFAVTASFSLTVWAICYHRVFDARQVFATLGRRISTLVVLASCIQFANPSLSEFLTEPIALTISACCGGLLATYWDRKVCRWLHLDAKQILAGPRAQIIEWAREEADVEKLTMRFEAYLCNWCQAELVSIHSIDSREPPKLILGTANFGEVFPQLRQTGYITAETLTRRRPDKEIHASKAVLSERNLAALIAVPRGSHSPSCVVAFGHKHSLRPYTYPDMQLLIELVELMDNILSQARAAMRTAQIERMESAAMMSRGLAHDLSNLATPVSSFLLHMESHVDAGSPEAEVLTDAKHSIKVMQDYIRESLFFARQHVPDFQTLSLSELLTTTIKLTQTRAQARGINLEIQAMADIEFTADRALMLRLMQNLVFNGIDASPRGGQVTLSGRLAEDDRIVLSVSDQGPGVPAELVDRIFQPYFTTKDTGNEVRGLGLGLAISLKISDLHGGELSVGKNPSGGAIFTFIAPTVPSGSFSASSIPIAI